MAGDLKVELSLFSMEDDDELRRSTGRAGQTVVWLETLMEFNCKALPDDRTEETFLHKAWGCILGPRNCQGLDAVKKIPKRRALKELYVDCIFTENKAVWKDELEA